MLTGTGKDDWDSFMQGISMDAGQSVWPVLPGLTTSTPNFMGSGNGGGGVAANGDGGGGGGGGGRNPQQSLGADVVSPGTIPGYQPLGADKSRSGERV